MPLNPIKKATAVASKLHTMLLAADASMQYTPELIQTLRALNVDVIRNIPTLFNVLDDEAELKEAAGFIDWPVDLLAKELQRELSAGRFAMNFCRIHRLSGCIAIKLSAMLALETLRRPE